MARTIKWNRESTLWIAPTLALLAGLFAKSQGVPTPACWTMAVAIICALWWIFEPIPIPATSLIPFGILPLTGVLSNKDVAAAYGHPLILLLMGGFILSTAMEKSGTHKRLALGIVRLVGGGGKRLVLGFMIATALLSMWISNTATTLMLLPVALAVIDQSEDKDIAIPLMLGIAYSASVGGIGTPVGTPPNVIFMGIYEKVTGKSISFLAWMKMGIPLVVCFIPIIWLYITRQLKQSAPIKLPTLGPWRKAEVRVLGVFFITAVAWITRVAPMGGWSQFLGPVRIGDDTVALTAAVIMFLIPDGEGERLLDWETAVRIPWGILLLFGGGIALAKAFGSSGLSAMMGQTLSGLTHWPVLLMLFVIAIAVTFLTEVTSNTATTTLLMPILAAAGVAANIDPALLMIPATMSASCAFMLPVATAPNAIVFGTQYITTQTMAREGFALNTIGAFLITALCYFML